MPDGFTTDDFIVDFDDRTVTCPASHSLPIPHEPLLRAARNQARAPEWQFEYRQHRPMVERSIAWLNRKNRNVRYRGVPKNDGRFTLSTPGSDFKSAPQSAASRPAPKRPYSAGS